MLKSEALSLVSAASDALKARVDEVNRLNVFPVPDGDTGTNMSLTMEAVVADVSQLPTQPSSGDVCRSITHGSLMGARGNSGVILSQILRGLCDVAGAAEGHYTSEVVADALERAVTVAFQAVRKPVEGTILTVLRDSATEARAAAEDGASLQDSLERVSAEAFESVKRTPELLPTLKENGVVDAGGYGLAIIFEGFVAALAGHEVRVADVSSVSAPMLYVVPADDWDDEEYLYCTEFLLHGDDLDIDHVKDFISASGGSELVVGGDGTLKIHVHTNDPGSVLKEMTSIGEVSQVHVNNMRRQKAERDQSLRSAELVRQQPAKPIGFVAVASGAGLTDILTSLGADVVVSGGQTMNPSTRDLLDAIESVDAAQVVVLPNNKNIIMTASAAAAEADRPAAVVPTTSIPQSFSALLAYDGSDDLAATAESMTEAACAIRSGEVTRAIKDAKGKVGQIRAGQVIGISDHEIEVVGEDVLDVAAKLAGILATSGTETLTVLAGADLDDASLSDLKTRLVTAFPEVEVETHRGDQPVYPVILSAE